MKYYLSLLLFIYSITTAFSQDTAKMNSSILLDYYQAQRFGDAVAYLKKTNPEPVKDIKILKSLAYCSQMDGKLPEAEAYYERVYQMDSTSTSVLFSLGSINLRRGNLQKAEDWYKQIILKDTTNFIVYKQLAVISIDKKNIADELYYLQIANRLNPQDPDIAADLSDFYVNANAYVLADKVLTIAITADPENLLLLESLVKLEYHQKKWPETAANCEKLVQLGDMSGVILTQMGIAYYNLNNYACGIESFSQLTEIEQTETTCYYTAACYKALKQYDKAIIYFQKTINLGISTNTNSYYSELADTYETIRKYKKAEFAYQKALQFNLTPLTYYSLANMYDTEIKSRKLALIYYKKYLATNPPPKQRSYINYAKSRVEILGKTK
jgi:tetratricopeptide (TPR) repeat protein